MGSQYRRGETVGEECPLTKALTNDELAREQEIKIIVNDILQDIEVVMTFLRTEDGGRKSQVFSG
jgi:hypothetical protein